ncbi:MAG: FmdB family transcriptional regulator [Anaerolineae bacterium]|nr:FmdB family transcriptional regulator [Anaerolineae bacterium]
MPVYTYQCEECGVRFDVRQKFSDDPVTECPECGSYVHRVPQAVGVVFKGGGWYVTDSRGRNNLAVPPKKEAGAGDNTSTKNEPASDASSSSTDTSSTGES